MIYSACVDVFHEHGIRRSHDRDAFAEFANLELTPCGIGRGNACNRIGSATRESIRGLLALRRVSGRSKAVSAARVPGTPNGFRRLLRRLPDRSRRGSLSLRETTFRPTASKAMELSREIARPCASSRSSRDTSVVFSPDETARPAEASPPVSGTRRVPLRTIAFAMTTSIFARAMMTIQRGPSRNAKHHGAVGKLVIGEFGKSTISQIRLIFAEKRQEFTWFS